ncbi:MAG: electron transport complex subunit RsxG [Halopseudomonas sp.]
MNPPTRTQPLQSRLSYPGLLLGAAALVATSLLTGMHLVTKTAIAERLAEDLQASLGQVIPDGSYDNDLLASPLTITIKTNHFKTENSPAAGEPLRVYRATQQGKISGLAFRQMAYGGYGGPIQLLLGIDPNGKLLGVRVLSHKETPGLGDKIERAKSDWVESFTGRSLGDPTHAQWTVKKQGGQFDQFTGATITPKAVILGVKAGLQLFEQQRLSLLAPIVSPAEISTDSAPHSLRYLSSGYSGSQDDAQTPVLPLAVNPSTHLPPTGGLK